MAAEQTWETSKTRKAIALMHALRNFADNVASENQAAAQAARTLASGDFLNVVRLITAYEAEMAREAAQ